MSDQFFEEEEELARADAAASAPQTTKAARSAAPAAKEKAPAPTQNGAQTAKPPSFGLVVAIAVVALLVGVCIGYFFAMSVVSSSASTGQSSSVTSVSTGDATSTSGTGEATSMPEGHPDVTSMMNPDGTVNEEALAEYKAQHAAEQSAEQGAGGEGADSADSSSNN